MIINTVDTSAFQSEIMKTISINTKLAFGAFAQPHARHESQSLDNTKLSNQLNEGTTKLYMFSDLTNSPFIIDYVIIPYVRKPIVHIVQEVFINQFCKEIA